MRLLPALHVWWVASATAHLRMSKEDVLEAMHELGLPMESKKVRKAEDEDWKQILGLPLEAKPLRHDEGHAEDAGHAADDDWRHILGAQGFKTPPQPEWNKETGGVSPLIAKEKHAYAYVVYDRVPGDRKVNSYMYDCCISLLTSIHSLRKQTTKPIIILADDVRMRDVAAFKEMGVEVRQVDTINGPAECEAPLEHAGRGRLFASWTKGNMFGLEDFDVVVYLDADTVVKRNIDFLFGELGTAVIAGSGFADSKCPQAGLMSAVKTNPGHFNSGVLVFRPAAALVERFKVLKEETPCDMTGDQETINALVKEQSASSVRCLDPTLNCRPDSGEGCVHDAYVLHWSGGSKPWKQWGDPHTHRAKPGLKAYQTDTVNLWWKTADEMTHDLKMASIKATSEVAPAGPANASLAETEFWGHWRPVPLEQRLESMMHGGYDRRLGGAGLIVFTVVPLILLMIVGLLLDCVLYSLLGVAFFTCITGTPRKVREVYTHREEYKVYARETIGQISGRVSEVWKKPPDWKDYVPTEWKDYAAGGEPEQKPEESAESKPAPKAKAKAKGKGKGKGRAGGLASAGVLT